MAKTKEKTKSTETAITVDAKSPPPEIEDAKPIAVSTFKHVEDYPEFPDFIQISKITGTLTKDFQDLTVVEKKQFEVGFHQWLKAGKPKPTMPEIPKSIIAAPVDIWRARFRQKEFFYYDTTAGSKIGVEESNGRIINYTEEYSVEKIKKLLDERDKITELQQPVHYYIIFDGNPHTIQPEDLLKPFDQVVEELKTGRIAA